MNPNKIEKMDMMRMKDIISQLTDVIYLLCDAKDTNITMIMEQFTNLTCEERDSLHITFSHKNKCNYSAPRLGYINFWSKQRKYNFCFIIALLRKVDNFSM